MTNSIPQAAIDAARQVLLNEDCLDLNLDGQEHYPGYHDAVVTAALEAALPHIHKQVAAEIRAEMPPLTSQRLGQTMRSCFEAAARIAEGESK